MPAWDPVCLATEGIPSRFLRLRTSATLRDRPGVAGILVVRCLWRTGHFLNLPLGVLRPKNCFPASAGGDGICCAIAEPAQQGKVFPAGTTLTRTEPTRQLVNADNPVPGLLLSVACYWTSSSNEPGVSSPGHLCQSDAR